MKSKIKLFIVLIVIFVISFAVYKLLFKKHPSQPGEVESSIEIVDGSIYRVYKTGNKEMLVDKEDYDTIMEFTYVAESPDGKKICFLGQSMVPIWLYYGNLNESKVTSVKRIDSARNCVWSNNSQKISYNNHTTDVSPVNVYVYDIKTDESTNFTESLQSREDIYEIRFYKEPKWSDDDSEVISPYSYLDTSGQPTREGISTINVSTGKITDSAVSD